MKVILAIDAIHPPLSGIGRYAWELARRLPLVKAVDRVRYFMNGRWVEDIDALIRPPAVAPVLLRKRRIVWPRAVSALAQRLDCKGQVFHGPNYFLPVRTDIGVITVHDLSVFKYPETHPVERLRHFEKEFAASLTRAAHVITDSIAIQDEFVAHFNWPLERTSVVPLGVASNYSPRQAHACHSVLTHHGLVYGSYVLCVSTLEPRKNLARLLEAWQLLPIQQRRLYTLVLVGGRGWLSDGLHQQIVHAEAEGWLRYLNFVPEKDLPDLYAGARVFVFPSSYEGFGLPVLEAMASGIPVVTSNRSSLPEIAGGAALLIDPDDVDSLAQSIGRAMEDEAWRANAIAQGLAISAQHSWDKCVARTCDVYAQTVSDAI